MKTVSLSRYASMVSPGATEARLESRTKEWRPLWRLWPSGRWRDGKHPVAPDSEPQVHVVHVEVPEQEDDEDQGQQRGRELPRLVQILRVKGQQHREQIDEDVVAVVVGRANDENLGVVVPAGDPDPANQNPGGHHREDETRGEEVFVRDHRRAPQRPEYKQWSHAADHHDQSGDLQTFLRWNGGVQRHSISLHTRRGQQRLHQSQLLLAELGEAGGFGGQQCRYDGNPILNAALLIDGGQRDWESMKLRRIDRCQVSRLLRAPQEIFLPAGGLRPKREIA